jgi:hypothetical protein
MIDLDKQARKISTIQPRNFYRASEGSKSHKKKKDILNLTGIIRIHPYPARKINQDSISLLGIFATL